MNLKISNPNYAARICKITEIRDHPNADRLKLTTVNGDVAIIDLSYEPGQMVVKFPLESSINQDFLSAENAFENSEKNKDNTKKGHFGKQGRVKGIKLRGVFCGCYIHPLDAFNKYFKTNFGESDEGLEFTDIGEEMVCKKYVPAGNMKGTQVGKQKLKKRSNSDLIADKQFRFHYDTLHMRRNLHKIDENDIVSVTYKYHGTSGITSNILVKRDLSLLERLAKFLGVKVQESEYGFVAASRKVIKAVCGSSLSDHGHYYGVDLWKHCTDLLKEKCHPGITLYYEVVGYTPVGKMIQKGYDYGCEQPTQESGWVEGKHFKILIYRITYTSPDGYVIDFDWGNVKKYCFEMGLNHVEERFYGVITWLKEDFISELERAIEADCCVCLNKVPMEGVVIRRETRGLEAFKLKSEAFRLYESKELDSGEENIEDEQEVE